MKDKWWIWSLAPEVSNLAFQHGGALICHTLAVSYVASSPSPPGFYGRKVSQTEGSEAVSSVGLSPSPAEFSGIRISLFQLPPSVAAGGRAVSTAPRSLRIAMHEVSMNLPLHRTTFFQSFI